MARISVDLPAPFAPSTATISPWRTLRSMPAQDGLGAIAGGEPADIEHRSTAARRSRTRAPAPRRGTPCTGVALDLGRRASGDAQAGIEHDHPVGIPIDDCHVVLDQHDGNARLGNAAQKARELRLVLDSR